MQDILLSQESMYAVWGLKFVIAIVALGLLSAAYFYLLRKDFVLKLQFLKRSMLLIAMLLVWLMGVALYSVGLYRDGLNFSAVVPDAVLASFKMFIIQNQAGRMLPELREDVVYMTLFTLTHFIAALLSVMFLMRLIGFRVKSAMNLWFCAHFRILKEKTVNIFWGMNEPAYLLAESIHHEKKKKNEYIFINTHNDDYKNTRVSLSSFFDVMNLDSSEMRRLSKIRAYVTTCYEDIASITTTKGSMFRKLRLYLVSKIIRRSKKTRIYFLSDDENYNINAALKLMKDRSVASHHVTIYVHAFGEKMNDIYNHYSMYSGETTKLKVVDSAYLSVTKLKLDPAYHPVSFVELDAATATVKSKAFNALVLGAGETGIEAFQFLYEFASFVDADGKKIPFHCYMLDKKMHQISAALQQRMPAIKEDELSFHTAAIDTQAYWELLDTILPTLNYVVVAVNDDDMGMYAALEIYKRASYLRNNNMKHFGIFVRCYASQNYYRMLNLAKRMTENNKESQAKMVIFGRHHDLYTYDLVVRESLLKQAMSFHKSYDEVSSSVKAAYEAHWTESFGHASMQKKLESVKLTEHHCAKLHVIQDFIRQKEQNLSNSLHMATKVKLLGLDKRNMAEYKAAIKTRQAESIYYHSGHADIDTKLLNLAKCEHIRWESSHKLMGYVCGEKSLIRKQHPCLVPWDELSELMQSYDCNVVDTSVKMYGN